MRGRIHPLLTSWPGSEGLDEGKLPFGLNQREGLLGLIVRGAKDY